MYPYKYILYIHWLCKFQILLLSPVLVYRMTPPMLFPWQPICHMPSGWKHFPLLMQWYSFWYVCLWIMSFKSDIICNCQLLHVYQLYRDYWWELSVLKYAGNAWDSRLCGKAIHHNLLCLYTVLWGRYVIILTILFKATITNDTEIGIGVPIDV